MRRVPRKLLPHSAQITRCLGNAARGPVWAKTPEPAVDAAVWPTGGLRAVSLDGSEYTPTARLFTDEDPGLRSLITSDRITDRLWVVSIRPWDGGGVSYVEAYLAPAPAPHA